MTIQQECSGRSPLPGFRVYLYAATEARQSGRVRVMLSRAKHHRPSEQSCRFAQADMVALRCPAQRVIQGDKRSSCHPSERQSGRHCHPQRSEGSQPRGNEILRFAQDDKRALRMTREGCSEILAALRMTHGAPG